MDIFPNISIPVINSNSGHIFNNINCSIFISWQIFGVIFNLLLIISWLLFDGKKNYSDILLVSNAISNFINGILLMPSYSVIRLIGEAKISKFFILLADFIDTGVFLISFLSLILLSYHRLRQLTKPFKEKAKLNRFRVFMVISLLIISLLIGFLKSYTRLYIISYEYCNRLFRSITNFFVFYVPMFIILILNFLILKHFQKKLRKIIWTKLTLKMRRKQLPVQLL